MIEFLLGDRYFENTELGWLSGNFVGIFFFIGYYMFSTLGVIFYSKVHWGLIFSIFGC